MKVLTGFMLVSLMLTASFGYSQEEKKCEIKTNVAADVMSRYVWRGLDYGASPSIQPTLSLGMGDFEFGYWGAMSIIGTYNEADLYLKYSKSGFTVMATDYFFPVDMIPPVKSLRYYNFESKTTSHIIEGSVAYKGSEKLPLSVLVGTSVYGADKDTAGDNRYSTYVELGYTFTIKNNPLDFFIGLTPQEGLYGNGFGVVNLGFTGYRKIKFSQEFELPVKVSVITNPQAENIHLVFGFTL